MSLYLLNVLNVCNCIPIPVYSLYMCTDCGKTCEFRFHILLTKPFSSTKCTCVSDKIMDLTLSRVKTAPSYQHLLSLITCNQLLSVYVPYIYPISWQTHSNYIGECRKLADIFIIMNHLYSRKSKTRTLLTKVPSFIISVVYYCTFCKHILVSEIMSYPCRIYCYSLMSEIMPYPCFIYCCSHIIFWSALTFKFLYLKTFLECWSNEITQYLLKYTINKLFKFPPIYFSNVG